MIIKTNDEKTVTLYRETYDDGILTESQVVKQALNEMNDCYIDILGDSILGSELEDYLKPEVYEKIKREYIVTYRNENVTSFEVPAYELLAEVIKVLSPIIFSKKCAFIKNARSGQIFQLLREKGLL